MKLEGSGVVLPCSVSALLSCRKGRVREGSSKVSSVGQGVISSSIAPNACLCKKSYFEVSYFCTLLPTCPCINRAPAYHMCIQKWVEMVDVHICECCS